MRSEAATCPMTSSQIVDEYFLECRAKVLELAAFLDRLDRARDREKAGSDFRVEALGRAISVLLEPGPGRASRVQMILSDPNDEPREQLDRKAAWGAYTAPREVY